MRKSSFLLLLATLFLGLFCTPASADPAADARAVVQGFYDRYAKVKDPEPWVKKSTQVTPAFKQAYTAFMKKDADSDPIIAGQDSPEGGYHVSEVAVKGDHATVTMSSKEKGFTKPIKVQVIQVKGAWLINGVNELRGK